MESSSSDDDSDEDFQSSAALQAELKQLRDALHGNAVPSDQGLLAPLSQSAAPSGMDAAMDGSETGSSWSGSSAEESSDGEDTGADPSADEERQRQPGLAAAPVHTTPQDRSAPQTAAVRIPYLNPEQAPDIDADDEDEGLRDNLLEDGFGRREMQMMEQRGSLARSSIRTLSKVSLHVLGDFARGRRSWHLPACSDTVQTKPR